jgi:ADP-ribosyl-[dinitrogen reductase] hydrolase
MTSDDTEHSCMVAQALIASGGQTELFREDFAKRLKWWIAGLPAGLGRATLFACVKLWFGAPANRSGLNSAGNGPAMRAAIIGCAVENESQLLELVQASTRVTHTDKKAEFGAVAVALASYLSKQRRLVAGPAFVDRLAAIVGAEGRELVALLRVVEASLEAGESTLDYAARVGMERGVSGYVYQTVPVAIHAWLAHQDDFGAAVSSVILCGGDADTTAAIVGGIVGARTGEAGIPQAWLDGICEWPRSVTWMRRLALQTTQTGQSEIIDKPISLNFFALLGRNLLFLFVVLFHGFRRLFPPY